ncbi:hypothetical protein [Sphingobium olei]|uniref:Uncharacterized protein n=1 Tax=Sphingobium olei TaxID=420955 RepID=A0ABW3P0D9_9SPHN
MTKEELAAKGHRAALAWEEFVEPAIAALRAAYTERLTEIAADEPWSSDKIVKFAVATRVIDRVEAQIKSAILNGIDARGKVERAREIEQLPAAKRKWLNI